LGARIDSLSINSHTVQRLSFVQTDSRPGSPAWYEDLQLTPNRSLEANEFWFVVASDLQNVQTVTGGVGLNITGTLYGPAWYIDLPSDIEVE
ncbi:hypothetical protein ACSLVQ_28000, partial [Klebsiella pneumoniae]|uniref:hypothetical protein n=1 Tax=Klebsiella pneumoniae TaxID=573 RepID=UPI003EE07793